MARSVSVLIFFLCTICTANDNNRKTRNYIFPYVTTNEPTFFNPYRTPTISYKKLKTFIEENKVKSIGTLLQKMSQSKRWSKTLNSPAYVRKTKSLHRSVVDPFNPRVILHHDLMTIAFPSRPDEANVRSSMLHKVEIFEFDPKANQLKAHVIDFSKEGKDRFIDEPVGCGDCHGEKGDFRYIMAGYPAWPGFYGGQNGRLDFKADFAKFTKQHKDNPRVKHLKKVTDFNRNNNILTQQLYTINAIKIMNNLKKTKTWRYYKYAILGAAMKCKNFLSFFPKRIKKQLENRIARRLLSDYVKSISGESEIRQKTLLNEFRAALKKNPFEALKKQTRENIEAEIRRLNSTGQGKLDFELDDTNGVSNLRFAIEGQGLQMKNWALNFPPGGYSYFFHRFTFSPNQFGTEQVLPQLLEEEPSLGKSLIDANLFELRTLPCGLLQERSVDALNEMLRTQTHPKGKSKRGKAKHK